MAGKSDASIASKPTFNESQLDLISRIAGLATRDIDFPGYSPVPGASPLQQVAFQRAAGFGSTPLDQARMGAIVNGLAGTPAFTVDPAERERVFQESIANPARLQFERETLPGIAEMFASRNLTQSGDFARAATDSAALLETGLAAQNAQLLRADTLDSRQAAEAGAARALASIPLAQGEALRAIDVPLNVGGVQRGIDAQQLGARYTQDFLKLNPQFNPALSLANVALQPQTTYIPQVESGGWFGAQG